MPPTPQGFWCAAWDPGAPCHGATVDLVNPFCQFGIKRYCQCFGVVIGASASERGVRSSCEQVSGALVLFLSTSHGYFLSRGLEMAGGSLIRIRHPSPVLGVESVLGAVYSDNGMMVMTQSQERTFQFMERFCAAMDDSGFRSAGIAYVFSGQSCCS